MSARGPGGRHLRSARAFRAAAVLLGVVCADLPAFAAATAAPAVAAAPVAHAPRVPWREDLAWDAAVAAASGRARPILLDFTATWCGPCRLLDVMVFTEDAVIAALADVVTLKVDVDRPGADDLPRRFQVTSLPTLVWCGPDGRERDRLFGYVSSARFLEIVADWKAGSTIDAGLARRLAAHPESPELLLESARRLRGAGRAREADVALRRLLNFAAVADTGVVAAARRELAELAPPPAAPGGP